MDDLSRWFRFIRLLMGGDLCATRREAIILSCTEMDDWEALGHFCHRHGIGPLISSLLFSIHGIPEKALQVFQGITERSLARYVILTHRMRKIIEEFDRQNIPVLLLKGPVLAETVYPNPVLRPFEDLDMLVTHDDLGRAARSLEKSGFSEISSEREKRFLKSGFHQKFRSDDGTVVELHWELLPPDFRAFPASALWEKARIHQDQFQTLSHIDEFIYACAHLAKHLAGFSPAKGIWISDLGRLIPDKISRSLSARIRKLQCRRMVFFAVALANRFRNLPPTKMIPWGKALEIAPITRKILYTSASPERVFYPARSVAPRFQKLINRSLISDDSGTAFRLPLAYLKRRRTHPLSS